MEDIGGVFWTDIVYAINEKRPHPLPQYICSNGHHTKGVWGKEGAKCSCCASTELYKVIK